MNQSDLHEVRGQAAEADARLVRLCHIIGVLDKGHYEVVRKDWETLVDQCGLPTTSLRQHNLIGEARRFFS